MNVDPISTKTVLWTIGGFLGMLKGLVMYIWWENKDKQKEHAKAIKDIKDNLAVNYYDKEKVDFIINPLSKSIDANTEATKELNKAITTLSVSLASK